jgi:UDP-N-acetylmuramate--alanine ligase
LISDSVCTSLPGRRVAYLPHRGEVLSYIRSTAREGDLVLTLGAGDVTSMGTELLSMLGNDS